MSEVQNWPQLQRRGSVLTEGDRQAIRHLATVVTTTDLAEYYGVSLAMIHRVIEERKEP